MAEAIKFILNGTVKEVRGLPATTTLLHYLRREAALTGTKEGCAEGDCGACTAIVGTLVGDAVQFKAINACIAFLPTLDGRQIITVEHLQSADALHPVQQAMVDFHGSQCGFCTPGFVVSLATMLHNHKNADDDTIQDAIAGNLCRCTGYRPILDAARTANKAKQRALPADVKGLQALRRKQMFAYEAADTRFFAPVTAAELAAVLAKHPKATLLAGGTDVGLWVTKMHKDLPTVIYTGNVQELQGVATDKNGNLTIGAAVSYTAAFDALAAYDPSMKDLLKRLGSVQIRNAGTVGGNIANGSPIGDGMPPLIALGTRITLRSQSGTRELPLEDYFLAYQKQDRREGEFVESILVPPKAKTTQFKTYKVSKRFDQDISAVCFALAFSQDGDALRDVRLAYGGMAATPKRASHAEAILNGQPWNEATLRAAQKALEQDFQPLTDMRASADYRLQVAKNLLERAFLDTTAPQTETGVYCYGQ